MGILQAIIAAILKALFGAINDGITQRRRDQAIKDLGTAEEQRNNANAELAAQKRADDIKPLDRDAAIERLRNGTF